MKYYILLIILMFSSININAQSFYVVGTMSKSQEGKVYNLFDLAIKKNGKINLYINGIEKTNKIKFTNINEFNSIKEKINFFANENNIEQYVNNVIIKNSKKLVKLIYQFETSENRFNIPTFPLSESSKKVDLQKKEVYILYLNQNNITIDNINIKNDFNINISNFELTGSLITKKEISKIQYRLNNEPWKDVDFELNQNTKIDFFGNVVFTKIGMNNLTLKITDIENSTKLFYFEKINFTQLTLNENNCRFIKPNKFGNNVEKRIFEKRSATVYWFKIETNANLDGLSFIRCDRNKNILVTISLRNKYVKSGENYYCFGLTRSELQLGEGGSDCENNQKGLNMLNWIYLQDNSNYSIGEMIPVVFSSITADQNKRQQILKAECEF